MSGHRTLAILSDIHFASAAERARGNFYLSAISNPARRLAIRLYRHYFWQRDPFAHNHLLDEFLTQAGRRSEEHTSELQSRPHLVCRLLLEKKKRELHATFPAL